MTSSHYGIQNTACSHVPKENNVLRRLACISRALIGAGHEHKKTASSGGLASLPWQVC